MSENSSKPAISIDLQTIFSIANVIKVIGIAAISFIVIWLNNSYVTVERFTVLQDRVSVMEGKVSNTEKQLENATQILKNIDLRISNLITPSGVIIYNDKILKMDGDIEGIKKDISYIRETLSKKQ